MKNWVTKAEDHINIKELKSTYSALGFPFLQLILSFDHFSLQSALPRSILRKSRDVFDTFGILFVCLRIDVERDARFSRIGGKGWN